MQKYLPSKDFQHFHEFIYISATTTAIAKAHRKHPCANNMVIHMCCPHPYHSQYMQTRKYDPAEELELEFLTRGDVDSQNIGINTSFKEFLLYSTIRLRCLVSPQLTFAWHHLVLAP